MKKDLVAVILAGGVGTRFWPLSTDKVLVPFFGKPFLYYTALRTFPKEVKKVVCIANDRNKEYIQSLKLPVPHVVVIQPEARGMADAILLARNELSGKRLLIYIADHYVDPHVFQQLLDKAEESQAFGVITGWKTDQYFPGGYLSFDGKRIAGIVEKPNPSDIPSRYVGVTGHYFSDSDVLIDELSKVTSDTDDVYEKALSKLMRHALFVMEPYHGLSASLKYSWHTLDCMDVLFSEFAREHIGERVVMKQNVIVDGPVYIDDDVRIMENTKIVGPVYIGKRTIIGNNSIIRHSHIGSDCVVGFNTDVTRSYIGNSCWFHSNYIGDSVLEENVSMGAGAVLANLRLDEEEIYSDHKGVKTATARNKFGAVIGSNVRIGVNCSVMPGVKIGSNVMIASGLVIPRDIPSNSFCSFGESVSLSIRPLRTAVGNDREDFKKDIKI